MTGPPEPRFDAALLRGMVEDVRQLGAVTASTVVDRFAGLVRGLGIEGGATGAAAVVDGARSLARWVAEATSGVLPGSPSRAIGAIETLHLPAAAPGASVTAGAWLHNRSGQTVTGVTLGCGDLLAADGAELERACVGLAPRDGLTVEPGSSLQVDVTVDVPLDQAPGRYQGLLLLSDPPGAALAISLEVTKGGST